ncbi:hypothetical protein ACFL6W_02610 [Thermodesulfobacteriota bacterium]
MIFSLRNIFIIFFALFFLTISPPLSDAFYYREKDDSYLELRGLARLFGNGYRHQNNDLLFPERSGADLAGLLRLIGEAQITSDIFFEMNLYQAYVPFEFTSNQPELGLSLDVERSAALEWSLSNSNYAHLAMDRLNLRWSNRHLDITAGRQAINLATTFFFSPNDFFAPFAAQTFYRLYKPGVDAVRTEVRLGNLSQLSMISVSGYSPDITSDTGWSNRPSRQRDSHLARISTVFGYFEWAVLGGIIHNNNTVGASIQGEIFSHIGLRAEGNLSRNRIKGKNHVTGFSIGIDRHFENSLDIRIEHFYNGKGASDPEKYTDIMTVFGNDISYLGRNYTAFGLGYEFTPLLRGDMSVIANMSDHSILCSFYSVYSLSNETDLSVNISIPFGKSPEGMMIGSEFGLLPYSLNIELRHFF